MPTFDPEDVIGRTFHLPPEENGEGHRAKVTRKVVETIDHENGHGIENINFILDIGNGKVEELISYNQLLVTCFYQKLRLCSCGTKPQHSRNHWCLLLHDYVSMRTPMSS